MISDLETINASEVVVRKFSGRKCNLENTKNCPIKKDNISPDMLELVYKDDNYCYIPENFCLGLAAKYLFKKDQTLFNPRTLRCIKYSCGHIFKSSDGNHRMCILKHLNEKVEVEMIIINSLCPNCKDALIPKS